MFQGQTIATIRQALAEGQIVINDVAHPVSEADVIAELEARHARHLAKGKGSTWPARILYRELTGKELPGTKTLNKQPKAAAKAPAKAAKQPKRSEAVKARASAKAAEQPVTQVNAELAERYAKTSTPQLENWLRRAKPDGDKAIAIRAELAKREEPKAPAKAKADDDAIERAKQALTGLGKEQLVALLQSLSV